MDHPKACHLCGVVGGSCLGPDSAAGSNKTNAGGIGDTHNQPGTA